MLSWNAELSERGEKSRDASRKVKCGEIRLVRVQTDDAKDQKTQKRQKMICECDD